MDYTYADDSLTLHTDMYQIDANILGIRRADLHAVLNVTLDVLIRLRNFCRFRTFSQLSRKFNVHRI